MLGGMYGTNAPAHEVFQLHTLVSQAGDVLCYATYNAASPLPIIGERHIFRLWWADYQLAAVLDLDAQWVHRAYPDNSDHEHCLLTWEVISATSNHPTGYHSAEHGWITEEAYQAYIIEDRLRLRRLTL
ncbi:MAG TPA: hypothetical protein VFI42_05740 [Thermomicrobiaceae bacterium]|nr:hypothetical protein [Thermomicrobiaceae bacterium]